MQENQPRRPQYIDGFVHNRQRRSVAYSKSHTGAAMPTLGTQRPQTAAPTRPIGDFKPHASVPKPAAAIASTSLPVRKPGERSRHATTKAVPQKRSWKRITKRTALVVLALFLVSGGWLGWKVYRNTAKIFGNKNPLHMLSAFKPVPLKGESSGHVNILLAGDSSDRDDGSGGGSLTDSIMVVSINTKEHTAFMLSIPRDMWVNVPGVGYGKINTAGTATSFDENGYPKGNMGALEKVIGDNFGIAINYYALVNYTAFKQSVDSVGGIDVNIQSEDAKGLYDPSFRANEGGALKLPNGIQHLDGQTALNLARARGDPFNGKYGAYGFPKSDFDRTEHQRWMMLALKNKIISAGTLSNPVKIGNLMDSVGNNVKTDFQMNELASLYYMMKKVDTNNIQSLSLNDAEGKNLLSNYTAPGGQSALVPAAGPTDYSQIQKYITKVFNSNKVSKEGANVTVLNGGQIVGLAKREGDLLATKGINVTQVGDAPSSATTTTVIDNSNGKKPETKKLLGSLFKNNFSTDAALAQRYNTDFVIVLGSNQPDVQSSTSAASAETTPTAQD